MLVFTVAQGLYLSRYLPTDAAAERNRGRAPGESAPRTPAR